MWRCWRGRRHERAARAIHHRSARADSAGDRRSDRGGTRRTSRSERIDRIFRAFHTLKGSAGVVDLPAMALSLHAAEDLLAAIHGGRPARRHPPSSIRRWPVSIRCPDGSMTFEAHGSLPAHAGEDARVMAGTVAGRCVPDPRPRGWQQRMGRPRPPEPAPRCRNGSPVWSMRRGYAFPGERASGRNNCLAISYEPHADCFFDGDDPLDLMRRMPELLALQRRGALKPWPPLADLDPFACNLRMEAIAGGKRASLPHVFRLVPDQIRIVDIPAGGFGGVVAGPRRRCRWPRCRAVVDEQRRILRLPQPGRRVCRSRSAPLRASPPTRCVKRNGRISAEQIELAKTAALGTPRRSAAASAFDETLTR